MVRRRDSGQLFTVETRWLVIARPRPDEGGETIKKLFKKRSAATRVTASRG
jgi:hypothetical protein